jgi:hypothetical protein
MKMRTWAWGVIAAMIITIVGWFAAPWAAAIVSGTPRKEFELKAYACSDPVPYPYIRNVTSGTLVPVETFEHFIAVTNRLILANTGDKTLDGVEVQVGLSPDAHGKLADVAVLFESPLARHEFRRVVQGSSQYFVLKLHDFNSGDQIAFKIEAFGPLAISALAKAPGVTLTELHTQGCANWPIKSYGGSLVFRETVPDCKASKDLGLHCEGKVALKMPPNVQTGASELVWQSKPN